MNITELRAKLHAYVDEADEADLRLLYSRVKWEMGNSATHYDETTMNTLYARRENHRNGISKSYTADESIAIIRSLGGGTPFEEEMERRFAEMENGSEKGYTLDETEARAREAYRAAKKRG
jgi:hypothetical protein